MKAMSVLLSILMLAGCAASTQQKGIDAASLAYSDYIGQSRTYNALHLRTTSASKITVEGEIELTMESPLTPLSIRPSDPNTAQQVVASVERMLKAGLLGFFGYRAIDSLSATRDPLVVEQPAPLVVNPVVVGP